MTIDQIKRLQESEDKVEFKEASIQYSYKSNRKSVLGYTVALANEGGGYLIFGVKENKTLPHEIIGSAAWEGREGKLEEDIFQDKHIRVKTEVLFEGAKRVLIIKVPPRPIGRVLKFEDVYLMRVGGDLVSMTEEKLLEILSEQEPDFSAKICPGLSLEDLDESAITKMKDAYARKKENPSFQALSTEQVLSDLKLLDNGKLNYAALLLVGKQEAIGHYLPHAKMIWEFRFTESQIHHDFREVVFDPLFVGIDKIWTLINEKNGNIPVQSDAYIFSVRTFNEAVIRESVLNSITHRDYSIGSEVVIKQYPKKIMICNPGGFPKGVNLDNLVTVSSTPRSRLMAEVLEKTGLVERSGQGVDKIFSYTLSEGKPEPDYQDSDLYQVTLKLYGTVTDKAFHIYLNQLQTNRKETNKLGVEEIIALYKVKQGLFGQVKPQILAQLERENLISRSGGGGNRYALSELYSSLAEREQRISGRYIVAEIDQFLMAIQGKSLKIGELEGILVGALNRNQIRYLINKLLEDSIITSEGISKGTRYKLGVTFDSLRGDPLINEVLGSLRARHTE